MCTKHVSTNFSIATCLFAIPDLPQHPQYSPYSAILALKASNYWATPSVSTMAWSCLKRRPLPTCMKSLTLARLQLPWVKNTTSHSVPYCAWEKPILIGMCIRLPQKEC